MGQAKVKMVAISSLSLRLCKMVGFFRLVFVIGPSRGKFMMWGRWEYTAFFTQSVAPRREARAYRSGKNSLKYAADRWTEVWGSSQ